MFKTSPADTPPIWRGLERAMSTASLTGTLICTGAFRAGMNFNSGAYNSRWPDRGFPAYAAWLWFPEVGRATIADWPILSNFPDIIVSLSAAKAGLINLTLPANRLVIVLGQLGIVSALRAHASLKNPCIASSAVPLPFVDAMRHRHFATALIAIYRSHAFLTLSPPPSSAAVEPTYALPPAGNAASGCHLVPSAS